MRRIALSITLIVVVLAVIVFGVGQLVLPGIAAGRLRDRLSKNGQVVKVEVDAFPAIELLWHRADRVVVRLGQYRSTPGHLGSLLQEAGDVGSLDARASEFDSGLLTLRNAVLVKRDDQLTGSAFVSEADLRASIPILQSVTPVASSQGQLTFQGTASFLGVSATADATVSVVNGSLVVQPDVPFGGFVSITLFSNPALQVQDVRATSAPGGFTVSAIAALR